MTSKSKKPFPINRYPSFFGFRLGRLSKIELTEKKDELSSVVHVDQRIQRMVMAVKNLKHNLNNCLRTGTKDEHMEKRKRRLEEHQMAIGLLQDAKELESGDESNLLCDIMRSYGDALSVLVDERVQTDLDIEKRVLDRLCKYSEDEKAINKIKEKLNRAALDMESNRRRLNTSVGKERELEVQEEFDGTQYKVDSYKDNIIADMYTLAAKEVDIASLFKIAEYHRTVIRTLENILPDIAGKIATYEKRPVFGCPLEDHLRYSHRKIALVLEVCCSALCEQGLKEEGLFRISGNATKVRRLKAGFDARELDLSDYLYDPHSLAAVLKSYLRELPEPLMSHNMHREWLRVGRSVQHSSNDSMQLHDATECTTMNKFVIFSLEGDERKKSIVDLLDQLAPPNRDNLAYLMRFLHLLLEYEQQTRMSASNLSIVMGPNLIGNVGEGDSMLGSRLVETLLINAEFFFPEEVSFTSSYTQSFALLLSEDSAGFEEEKPTKPVPIIASYGQLNFNSAPDHSKSDSFSLQKPAFRRPKLPAPPPPLPSSSLNLAKHRPISSGEYDNLASNTSIGVMSQNLVQLGGKTSPVESNDSMGEYTHDNDKNNQSIGDMDKRNVSLSAESLPEDPPQEIVVSRTIPNWEKINPVCERSISNCCPSRPPPPTQLALERNTQLRDSRPFSYMCSIATKSPPIKPRKYPLAPPTATDRTHHQKTSSFGGSILLISDDDVDEKDGNSTNNKANPPIAVKPLRNNNDITKL